jgi:uncharacterized protein Usg
MKFILVGFENDEHSDFNTGKECVTYLVTNHIRTADILLVDDDVIEKTYVWHDYNLWTKLPRDATKHLDAWIEWP